MATLLFDCHALGTFYTSSQLAPLLLAILGVTGLILAAAGTGATKTWFQFVKQIIIVVGLFVALGSTLYISSGGGYQGQRPADNFLMAISMVGFVYTMFSLCRPALGHTLVTSMSGGLLGGLILLGVAPGFDSMDWVARLEMVISLALIIPLSVNNTIPPSEKEQMSLKYVVFSAFLGAGLLCECAFGTTMAVRGSKEDDGDYDWENLYSSPLMLIFKVAQTGHFGSSDVHAVAVFGSFGGTFLASLLLQMAMWCFASPQQAEKQDGLNLQDAVSVDETDEADGVAPRQGPLQSLASVQTFEDGNGNQLVLEKDDVDRLTVQLEEDERNAAYDPALPPTNLDDDTVSSRVSFAENNLNNLEAPLLDGQSSGGSNISQRKDGSFIRFSSVDMDNPKVLRHTPNFRIMPLAGTNAFRATYFTTFFTSILWIYALLFIFFPQNNPCDVRHPYSSCSTINDKHGTDISACWSANHGKYCYTNPPWTQWLAYALFTFSEVMNFFLSMVYHFNMWRPIRRAARFLNHMQPQFEESKWPTVDVFICHYSEPAEDTIETLTHAMAMDYPSRLLHIWILDDGYFKSSWDNHNQFRITINNGVIDRAGNLRMMICRHVYRIIMKEEPDEDDKVLKPWRKKHTTVKEFNPNDVNANWRMDCAVGSVRDDYVYEGSGMPSVTYVGRMKPETHHAKAGNINNVLFNEKASGKFVLFLDNDMKPHPKFLLSVLPFFFTEVYTENGQSYYSDHVRYNKCAFVQTPQYFDEEDPQLRDMADPCGHRNTIFFDAVECGRDGFNSASFAGTNAVFRRQALDSVCGINYGTQTEDTFTGGIMHSKGWDSVYFRKDFLGSKKERIRLCEGAIPETVAASMGQRKRWAKGAVQILLMKKEDLIDPNWRRPRVEEPVPDKSKALARLIFHYDSIIYPFGSLAAIFYMYIAIYYSMTGNAPIFTPDVTLLIYFLPMTLSRWFMSLLCNRVVDNNDVWRAQQTWFGYAYITLLALYEALHHRITGVEQSWANTGAGAKTSIMEIPNIVTFCLLSLGVIIAIVRFYDYEDNTSPWNFVASVFFTLFIMSQLWPMTKMSLQAFLGFDKASMTFSTNIVVSLALVGVIVFVQMWEKTRSELYSCEDDDGGR